MGRCLSPRASLPTERFKFHKVDLGPWAIKHEYAYPYQVQIPQGRFGTVIPIWQQGYEPLVQIPQGRFGTSEVQILPSSYASVQIPQGRFGTVSLPFRPLSASGVQIPQGRFGTAVIQAITRVFGAFKFHKVDLGPSSPMPPCACSR